MLPIDLGRACASAAGPTRTDRARSSPAGSRAVEQIDVLVDRPPDEHHDLIVEHLERPGALLLQRRVVLDQALRDVAVLDRAFFDARAAAAVTKYARVAIARTTTGTTAAATNISNSFR